MLAAFELVIFFIFSFFFLLTAALDSTPILNIIAFLLGMTTKIACLTVKLLKQAILNEEYKLFFSTIIIHS